MGIQIPALAGQLQYADSAKDRVLKVCAHHNVLSLIGISRWMEIAHVGPHGYIIKIYLSAFSTPGLYRLLDVNVSRLQYTLQLYHVQAIAGPFLF
jgi:hypothetical protein